MIITRSAPKRKFVGARTREYRFARYVEDWRIKVERIGNLNYPEAARKGKLYGNLQLTVSIRADGSLESIEINRSSGEKFWMKPPSTLRNSPGKVDLPLFRRISVKIPISCILPAPGYLRLPIGC